MKICTVVDSITPCDCRRWYYWADRLGMLVWQDFPCISDKHNMEEANTEDKEVFREDLFTFNVILGF